MHFEVRRCNSLLSQSRWVHLGRRWMSTIVVYFDASSPLQSQAYAGTALRGRERKYVIGTKLLLGIIFIICAGPDARIRFASVPVCRSASTMHPFAVASSTCAN